MGKAGEDRAPLSPRPSREQELAEAHGHLIYWQRQQDGQNFALRQIQTDLKTSEKEVQRWSAVVEKLEGKQKQKAEAKK